MSKNYQDKERGMDNPDTGNNICKKGKTNKQTTTKKIAKCGMVKKKSILENYFGISTKDF